MIQRQDNIGEMFKAIADSDTEKLEILLNSGVNVNATDKNGFTAFMRAVELEDPLDQTEMVEFLLSKNANVNLEYLAKDFEKRKKIIKSSVIKNIPITEQSYKQIYDAYINSNTWIEKKAEIANTYKLNDWNVECVRCGYKYNLQVHHNYYINNKYFGHENISDTDYLCAKCHKEWHGIQKSSGSSQNRLSEEYYNFITADKTRIDQVDYLLTEKIKADTLEVERYFSRADVVKYNKISGRLDWMFLMAIILLFAYGIGIIIMIIACFIKNEEPENLGLYRQKRNSLESKKCHLELRKYYNHN